MEYTIEQEAKIQQKIVEDSLSILSDWLNGWVLIEEYEKAQACKNLMDKIKENSEEAIHFMYWYNKNNFKNKRYDTV